MCIGHKDTDSSGWKFSLPMVTLYLFLLLGSLGANDSQARILEKMIALEETLQELMVKINGLDRRITALEKGMPPTRPEKPMAAKPRKGIKKDKKKVIDIGQGFYVLNLDFEGIVENTIFTGELENSGSRDYQFALISVEAYDEKGNVLGKEVLNVTGMPAGSTKPFKVTIYGVNVKDVASYNIKFVKGF
ncbi:MAG: FxLYD domain-containing protein [Candidatus Brocadiales bacterium]